MFKKIDAFLSKQVVLLKVWVKYHAFFLTVITQIGTFSFNLESSIKNFETTKYSLERSFQKEWEYHKKKFFRIFRKNTAF